MTSLSRTSSARDDGRMPAASRNGDHVLLTRLQKESDRQVPFSEARLLLREAALAIERLAAEVARLEAQLAAEPSECRAPAGSAPSVVKHDAQQ